MAGSPIKVTNVDGSAINTIAPTYTEGDTDATITGPVVMWEDAADTLRAVSAAKPLPVGVITLPAIFGAALVDVNAAVTADVDAAVAAAAGLRLMGFNVRESKSSAAVCTGRVIHGATGATAAPLHTFELAADTEKTYWFGPQGIACASGLSVDHIAGEFDIILYYMVAA